MSKRVNRSRKLREQRQQESDERTEVRAERSPQQQLKLISQRPGKSVKDRARLEAQIETVKEAKKAKEGSDVENQS